MYACYFCSFCVFGKNGAREVCLDDIIPYFFGNEKYKFLLLGKNMEKDCAKQRKDAIFHTKAGVKYEK